MEYKAEKSDVDDFVNAKIENAFEKTLRRIPDSEARECFRELAQNIVRAIFFGKIASAMEKADTKEGINIGELFSEFELNKFLDEAIAEAPSVIENEINAVPVGRA